MIRACSLLTLAAVLLTDTATAQAPPTAELWRVGAGALAVPAALQVGATSGFWNPASPNGSRAAMIGVEVIHTSEILGLSGLMLGGSLPNRGPWRAGVVLGRMQVRDLVRTTTSPDSEDGTIPVYEQFGGVQLAFQRAAIQIGALAAFHHARFDVQSETGFTLDLGVRAHPVPRLTVAASTHLFPVTFTTESTTDYYFGAEYLLTDGALIASLETQVAVQYGAAYRPSGSLDHTVNAAMTVGGRVRIDAAITSESAYGRREWRPALAVGLRFGRYRVVFSHGSGVNDAGGTYRVGLDVELGG